MPSGSGSGSDWDQGAPSTEAHARRGQAGLKTKRKTAPLPVSDDWEEDDAGDDGVRIEMAMGRGGRRIAPVSGYGESLLLVYNLWSLAIPRHQSSLPKLGSCARQTCLWKTYSLLGKWALVFWDGVGTILKRRSSALV
ncbi:hypothetical protein K438DRAFT_2015150 [Mycena galopus ATCC 62051]|nr:hypothetical protein K438DRAFT_2015150 [Mycena galopus ATCC 62051]